VSSPGLAAPRSGLWPHIRGVLVAAHVAAVCVAAIPAPVGGLNRKTWKDPTVQAELDVWYERLQSAGLELGREEYEQQLFVVARSWVQGRHRALRFARPYFMYLGTKQSWRMFVAPHTHPSRLNVDIREGDTWYSVYQPFDAELRWGAEIFEDSRFRSAVFRYSWPNYKGEFKRLAQWVAVAAGEDFPEADAVRLRWLKRRTPTPRQARKGTAPEGHFRGAVVVELDRD
jgi:hypothetical protein